MSSKKNPVGWRFEAGQKVTAYPHTDDFYHAEIFWTDGEYALLADREDGPQSKVRTIDLARGWLEK